MNINEAIQYMNIPDRKITRKKWMEDLNCIKWLESFAISPKYPSSVGLVAGSTTDYYTVGCSYRDYRPGAGPTNFFDMYTSCGAMSPFSIDCIPKQIYPTNNFYQENLAATDWIELTNESLTDWKLRAKDLVKYCATPTGPRG